MNRELASQSDEDLVELVCCGNTQAFAVLVKRHTPRFYQYAAHTLQSRADAEDAVQTAFIKLWQHPHRYNSDKSRFTTWFYRVVLNECRDQLRRVRSNDQRIQTFVDELYAHQRSEVSGEDDGLHDRRTNLARQSALEFGMTQLAERERDALNLVVFNNVPQSEAAEVLGVGLKALESILARAKRKLAALVSQSDALFESEQLTATRYAKIGYGK